MADMKDEMDSTVSGFSMISINGEEMDAEKALDEACKDIQSAVNEIHSYGRQLLMADERDDSYEDMEPLYTNLVDLLKDGQDLFKDFKSICKQMLPPKPRAARKKVAPGAM